MLSINKSCAQYKKYSLRIRIILQSVYNDTQQRCQSAWPVIWGGMGLSPTQAVNLPCRSLEQVLHSQLNSALEVMLYSDVHL